MPFNISQFRAKLSQGGARPNLFEVIVSPPGFVGLNVEQFSFMCKAASLPQSTIAPIPEFYFGLPIKLAGNRTYDDWQVRVINDETFDVRNALERWSTAMASHTTENEALRGAGAGAEPSSYVGTALVNQYGKEGNIVKTYELVNVFPPVVGGIELAWEANNTIEEFPVVFTYDFFRTNDGIV